MTSTFGTMQSTSSEHLPPAAVPIRWTISPAADLSHIEALPPAAQQRHLKRLADTFASTGRNVFVHYAEPILTHRREILLRTTNKRGGKYKSAAQLYQQVGHEESFYWHEVARELRQCMKTGVLTTRDCLTYAGRAEDHELYIWHAEVAVAGYLGLPQPPEPSATETDATSMQMVELKMLAMDFTLTVMGDETKLLENDDAAPTSMATPEKHEALELTTTPLPPASQGDVHPPQLLDTLPDRFTYDRSMMYSHFARYSYKDVRHAEGKHQIAMLRQLADRFDKTGKILFYYYLVPRLCKLQHPVAFGETVTGQAADVWRFLPDSEKAKWLHMSARLKKTLGDGNLAGLITRELDSLDNEVLELHEMAEIAMRGSINT